MINPISEALAEKHRQQDIISRLYTKQKEYDFKIWCK